MNSLIPSTQDALNGSSEPREFYRQFLRRVLIEVCKRKGTDTLACAELKVKLQEFAFRETPSWEFNEQEAAKVLYPGKNAEFYLNYRFREFCGEFPDVMKLQQSSSGDFAKINSTIDVDPAKELLRSVLKEFYVETGKSDIACSALKVRMKKATSGAFDEETLGFANFRDFLKSQSDVQFISYDSGGRVQFAPPPDAVVSKVAPDAAPLGSMPHLNGGKMEVAAKGYLLIDGDNVRSTIYKLLGHKAQPDQLPRWEVVLQGIKKGPFVAPEWKAVYFLGVHGAPSPSLSSFRTSLTLMGYEVVSVKCESDMNAGIQTEKALLKTLEALSSRNGHVMVVSHSQECGRVLKGILGSRNDLKGHWGVVGIKEMMSSEIHDAVHQGLALLDLERDYSCIPSPLPRHIEISADEFDPACVLN